MVRSPRLPAALAAPPPHLRREAGAHAAPAGPERVRLSLSFRKGVRMKVTEAHPVEED